MHPCPKDPDWRDKVRASFANQPFMAHLGASLRHLEPGAVDIELTMKPELTQQHGFLHAGATSSIADSAAGYAALSLFPANTGVVTSEYKINLLAPARAETFLAKGRIVKPGRTLSIAKADVYATGGGDPVHVATGLFTLVPMPQLKD